MILQSEEETFVLGFALHMNAMLRTECDIGAIAVLSLSQKMPTSQQENKTY